MRIPVGSMVRGAGGVARDDDQTAKIVFQAAVSSG